MFCMGLKHNLLPTKKAWKKLGSAIRTRVSKLKRSTIVAGTIARFNTVDPTCDRRRRTSRPPKSLHRHGSSAPVYVDDLYNEPEPARVEHVEPEVDDKLVKGSKKSETNSPFGAPLGFSTSSASASASASWEASMPSAVRGMGEVDLRAEMFIRRFKEEMRLQSQRSLVEFQEMLARGV